MTAQSGKVLGRRLPDGDYELIAFVDGQQVTHPFLHKAGAPMFKGSIFSGWEGLLSAEALSEDTLIYPIADLDQFIDAIGMKRL